MLHDHRQAVAVKFVGPLLKTQEWGMRSAKLLLVQPLEEAPLLFVDALVLDLVSAFLVLEVLFSDVFASSLLNELLEQR
jgi:hypothetical protein